MAYHSVVRTILDKGTRLKIAPVSSAVLLLLVIHSSYVTAQNTTEDDPSATTCLAGFYGDGCSRVCESDRDCLETSESCHSGFSFLTEYPTIPKSYICTATSPDLVKNLIKPDSVRLQCLGSAEGKTGSCRFTFGIEDYANEVSCEATACDAGGNAISCDSITCECMSDEGCATGSTFVKAFVNGVTGTASLTCNDSGECTLGVPEFLVPEIAATCATGQCVPKDQEQQGEGATTDVPTVEYDGSPVNAALNACIAAIPTIVLCFISVMVLLYWFKISSLYDVVPPDAKKCVEGTASVGEGHHRLEWIRVSVHVNLSKTAMTRRKMRHSHTTTHMYNGTQTKDLEFGNDVDSRESRILEHGESHDDKSTAWAILSKCSGEARSGEVVGVLGPSGCGKTTLLSALSGDSHGTLKHLSVSGEVRWNGASLDPTSVAFMPQMDSLIPTMTVREQLLFTGSLKLDISSDLVKHRVQKILEELGIEDIAEEYVGGSANIRGISGGERRRVAIGMALVCDPQCIVLDEPLSGLDSYNALIVTKTLKALAMRGRVVLYSMHQPSDEMFNTLDTVLFMAHGRVVYQGSPVGARELLNSLDISVDGRPIADSMIDLVSNPETLLKVIRARSDIKSQTEISEDLTQDIHRDKISWKNDTRTQAGVSLQLVLLFDRTFKDIWRNKSLLVLHVIISICAGLIVGGIFYDVSVDTDGVQARYGSIFISLCFLAFTSITSIDLLINERAIVTAEVNQGLYSGALYIMSKLFLDGLLLRALPATLYAIPFYFMVGFVSDAARFFSFLFTLILFNLCIGALAVLVTICSKTAGTSLFVMNTLLLLQLSLTGFLVEVDSITPVLRWIHWLSQFYYAFEAMITTEMNQNKYNLILEAPGLKPVILENTPGEMFIDTLGYEVDTATRNICILIGYYYGFACLSLLAFYIRQHWNWRLVIRL